MKRSEPFPTSVIKKQVGLGHSERDLGHSLNIHQLNEENFWGLEDSRALRKMKQVWALSDCVEGGPAKNTLTNSAVKNKPLLSPRELGTYLLQQLTCTLINIT